MNDKSTKIIKKDDEAALDEAFKEFRKSDPAKSDLPTLARAFRALPKNNGPDKTPAQALHEARKTSAKQNATKHGLER